MRTLTYWIAPCKRDSHVYSIRAKTKKEVVAKLNSGDFDKDGFDPPTKVQVEYSDAFDLVKTVLSEDTASY